MKSNYSKKTSSKLMRIFVNKTRRERRLHRSGSGWINPSDQAAGGDPGKQLLMETGVLRTRCICELHISWVINVESACVLQPNDRTSLQENPFLPRL